MKNLTELSPTMAPSFERFGELREKMGEYQRAYVDAGWLVVVYERGRVFLPPHAVMFHAETREE